jgi:hypothetical protein
MEKKGWVWAFKQREKGGFGCSNGEKRVGLGVQMERKG